MVNSMHFTEGILVLCIINTPLQTFFSSEILDVLIMLFLPLCVNSRCEEGSLDMFVAHMYQRTGCGLTQVPSEIPAEATLVRLDNNKISVISPAAFSNLTKCTILWLSGNKLINISAAVFDNMSQLKVLNLENNQIDNIQSGAFAKLTAMKVLNLQGNALTTLERDVFGKLYPTYLTLLLSRNPLECDSRICWIKQFERDGWIMLNYNRDNNFLPKPDCTNYPGQNWDNVTLTCPSEGTDFFPLKKCEKKFRFDNDDHCDQIVEKSKHCSFAIEVV